jgi:hypothetical protein
MSEVLLIAKLKNKKAPIPTTTHARKGRVAVEMDAVVQVREPALVRIDVHARTAVGPR